MKKQLILSLILFIGIGLSAQIVVKYTTVNLNVRQDTTINAKVITVLPKGTSVRMQECDCKWIPISYEGKTGYVSSKYLSKSKASHITSSTKKHYINSAGERVQSPTYYNSVPTGATALCRDGTYSFSSSRRGTCSHHGGVAQWY